MVCLRVAQGRRRDLRQAPIHAVSGFTNHSLWRHVAGLLDASYSTGQMTYDLRGLRLGGPITRTPHPNSYTFTLRGSGFAVIYIELQILEADQPPAPAEFTRALTTIDRTIRNYFTHARLGTDA